MVKIVGHRGAAGYAPENTLLSFQTAIDIGCDRLELDVRLSKDHRVVIFHNKEVSGITDGQGLVRDLTLAELRNLHLPKKQHICTLQEAIEVCKNKIDLQIELKEWGTPLLVEKLIEHELLSKHVVVTSFDVNLLRQIKKLNSKLKVGLLFAEYSRDLWKIVKDVPLDFIGPKADIVTQDMVSKAHKLGITVYAYNVIDKKSGEGMIAMGVDEIGTDFPKLFICDAGERKANSHLLSQAPACRQAGRSKYRINTSQQS